jgi:hypothetical protein
MSGNPGVAAFRTCLQVPSQPLNITCLESGEPYTLPLSDFSSGASLYTIGEDHVHPSPICRRVIRYCRSGVRPGSGTGAGVTIPLVNPNFDWNNPAAAPYINPAAFVRSPNGVYGNTPRNIAQLRTPWDRSEDVSLLKNFYFAEQKYVELRGSAFNVGNRHTIGGNAGAIHTSLDSGTFGMITNP